MRREARRRKRQRGYFDYYMPPRCYHATPSPRITPYAIATPRQRHAAAAATPRHAAIRHAIRLRHVVYAMSAIRHVFICFYAIADTLRYHARRYIRAVAFITIRATYTPHIASHTICSPFFTPRHDTIRTMKDALL